MSVSSQMRSCILSFSPNSFETHIIQTILANQTLLSHLPPDLRIDDQSPHHRNQLLNLLNDLDFLKNILRTDISLWAYIPNHLKNDPSLFAFYKQLYMSDPINLQDFHKADITLRDDLEIANWAVSHEADHYISLSLRLKDSETLLRKVIQTHPYLYEYASARLKNHQEIAQIVLRAYPASYRFIAKNLITNHEFIINLMMSDYDQHLQKFSLHSLWHLILNLWELDHKVLLQNPIAQLLFVQYRIDIICQYFPKEQINQRDLVKAIVTHHKWSYYSSSILVTPQYINDKEIVMIALNTDVTHFHYISANLRNDPDVFSVFIRNCDDVKRVKDSLSLVSRKTIYHKSVLKLIAQKWPNEVLFQTKNLDDHLLYKIVRHQQKKQKS
jgi:hypothetical protein